MIAPKLAGVEMVDPYAVAAGETIRPLPAEPGSDGVVSWTDIDDHGDETYHLTDGRSYWHRHTMPVARVQSGGGDR